MKHAVWVRNFPAERPVPEVVDVAVAAEEAGWDGVLLSDSITEGFTDGCKAAALVHRTFT